MFRQSKQTTKKNKKQKKMNSETDFSSDRNYAEFANEIPFVGEILQPFLFEPILTAAAIQAKKDLRGTSVVFDRLLRHRT